MNQTQPTDCTLIIDTNILLDIPNIHNFNWGVQPVNLKILQSVRDELRGLARDQMDRKLARTAQSAFDKLNNLQRRAPAEGYPLPGGGHLCFTDDLPEIAHPLDAESVDHKQIALALTLMKAYPNKFCAIVTRDREMADIAAATRPNVLVVMPVGNDIEKAIQAQLPRLIEWWQQFHEAAAEDKPQPIKQARASRQRPDRQARIRQVVRRLYGQIRSARHRAILAIAPLELRLALSTHLIEVLTAKKRRVVFLFVQDAAMADWWAAELHRRCQLPNGSVFVFGGEPIARVGPIRVVIYRHDQIERRVDQHMARFRDAGRRVSAVVDGCDLMEPVEIAMLLFECDQFIGFTRHDLKHVQAVGGRMLSAFFQQQTVASYTFADGEQDGWLHSFDVIRRPTPFNDEELKLYQAVNDEFLACHARISLQYPALNRSRDFWQTLHRILDRAVDSRAAELFALRERREEAARLTANKLEVAARLIAEAAKPARCLIFDYDGLWTKLLQERLAKLDRSVAVAGQETEPAAWEQTWRQFEAAKLDCLILKNMPPPGAVKAQIKRLILLTPLAPLTSLAAMVDWTLSHAASGSAVSVDLLYTVDTPEQQAMIAFAETCCGLRFGQ